MVMRLSKAPKPMPLADALDRLVGSLEALGGSGELRESCVELVRRYRSGGRFTHSLEVICRRVAALDFIPSHMDHEDEVRVALWLNHAELTEDPLDTKDANRSFATAFLRTTGAGQHQQSHDRLMALVGLAPGMVTEGSPRDQRVAADVRHMEFGFPRQDYAAHERSLRQQYPRVDADEWAAYRHVEIRLLSLRPRVFFTPLFIATCEENAQKNIRWALERFDYASLE